jgi:hemerythrin
MEEIRWDDGLSVGIDLIDEQHKMLIQKIVDVTLAVKRYQGGSMVMKTLDFLIDYTDFHFSTEETNMVKFNYPELDYHKAQHEEFKVTLSHLLDDFEDEGGTVSLGAAIKTFLFDWLVNHIKTVDVKFGTFLKEEGLVMSEEG